MNLDRYCFCAVEKVAEEFSLRTRIYLNHPKSVQFANSNLLDARNDKSFIIVADLKIKEHSFVCWQTMNRNSLIHVGKSDLSK